MSDKNLYMFLVSRNGNNFLIWRWNNSASDQAVLTWLVVHVVVVGWMFGGVVCHATRKGAELSCELDYAN